MSPAERTKGCMTVVEVDQWTATGDIEGKTIFDLSSVRGGDSTAAKKLGIAFMQIKCVAPEDIPDRGRVWFLVDNEFRLSRWKSNCDSSD